jgi:hypothetical protein
MRLSSGGLGLYGETHGNAMYQCCYGWYHSVSIFIPTFIRCSMPWTGLAVTERVCFVKSGDYHNSTISSGEQQVYTLTTACFSLSVATNAVATGLIAYRAWQVKLLIWHILLNEAQEFSKGIEKCTFSWTHSYGACSTFAGRVRRHFSCLLGRSNLPSLTRLRFSWLAQGAHYLDNRHPYW